MSQDANRVHRAAQVAESGAAARVVPVRERPPGAGEVRIDVAASGICGADIGTVRDSAPAAGFPITPGHEVAGAIAELGPQVRGWDVGERVAVGWFGGSCGHCSACRTGDVVHCPERKIPGMAYPGGWSSTLTVPASALARIPEGLSLAEAAPFGCAGVTTFNALRHSGAGPGDLVAVLGIGGLGHLAVQFAAAMGYETVAVGRGEQKRQLAQELGARHYIDTERQEPGAALRELGGARLILSTASSGKPLAELVDGLAPHGRLTIVGFDGSPLNLPLAKLVMGARSVTGHLTGSPADTEQAMRFAVATGVRPRVQTVSLEEARQALDVQQDGEARFRMVLVPGA
ncbi:alcohol dehydrogenase catalytic domain-containing protein [Streptomyces sp. S.PNR 29]|uniref:alcohol dehydrogenase catalytic domain-containing protein n=1 Tax=Streptomyces sp. S.PNR 29 TaxID=2973805 RepID=UPI0025B0A37E|nr:alcohol dehydrogenase catalytic domain-containing protein [Streptomyces sp. S.PNR 29]MDN0198585.1 alcohol dehydrogenase catalytic domain-containing protein [Streptomyces sp. S.PNR 29]